MKNCCHRRKFRSQTSNNMDRWRAEVGRVREEKRREEEEKRREEKGREGKGREGKGREEKRRRRRSQKKEDPGREKVGKSRKTVFFQWFVAPEGWKVGSLKRRVRSQLAKWEMKNCTPLWREAHFEVKIYKAHQVRATFGSWDVEKVEVKNYKAHQVRTTFGSWDVEKVHAVVARSTFRSKNVKHHMFGPLLEVQMSFRVAGATGLCTLSKVSKTWGFCGISKNDGRRGTFEEDLPRWIFCGRRATRDMFIRDARRSGRWFPESGCILEHQIFSFGKMILRDRCSTAYDLASLFRGRHNTLGEVEKSHEALVRGCQLCTQLSIFEGSLAELLRFWCCQLRKMRKSRRIVSFLMLSSSKIEEVSRNCCVLKLTVIQTDRQADKQIDR